MTNGEKIQTILDVDKDCTEVRSRHYKTFAPSNNKT